MRRFITLTLTLLLIACQGEKIDPNLPQKPYDKWEISGRYPHYFRVRINQVTVVTQSGKWYPIAVEASDNQNYKTPGAWRFPMNAHGFYYDLDLPKLISLCWVSFYDETIYSTRIELPLWARQKMIERVDFYSEAYEKMDIAYYDRIIIGVAPGGNVTLWLAAVPFVPYIEITQGITTERVPTGSDVCPYNHPIKSELSDEAKAWLKKNGMPKAWQEENNNIGLAPDIRIKDIPVLNIHNHH